MSSYTDCEIEHSVNNVRANQDSPHQLLANDPYSISSAPFVRNAPIKIIIHGYLGNKDASPNHELRPEYMKCCNYNLISVDYNPLVRMPCYIQAAQNTELVGKCTAQLVDTLVQNYGFDLASIHAIGFSLGGQAAGFLGNYLRSGRLNRITGLDVALPLFVTRNKNKKLDASDAIFVDVVHTNALMCGKFERCGTVDFFGNNGLRQPGCTFLSPKDLLMFIQTINCCSHTRAAEYFAESINTRVGFYGMKCTTWIGYITGVCKGLSIFRRKALFGEHVLRSTQGLYFFPTNSKSPFAISKLRSSSPLSDSLEEESNELADLEDLIKQYPEPEEEDAEELVEVQSIELEI